MILTLSNLYPRPDRPQFGLYNLQLFAALHAREGVRNVCPVPEWRVWRWPSIRRWTAPTGDVPTRYVPYLHVPRVGRDWAARTLARALRPVTAEARAARAVYAAWLYPDAVAATALAADAGRPVWWMALGSDAAHAEHPGRGAQLRAAAARCAGIVCVAAPLAKRLADAGLPTERLHVVPNGVDGVRFAYRSRDEARRLLGAAWPVDLSRPVALCVGNLVPVKGVDLLPAISRAMTARRAEPGGRPCLLVAGAGPLRGALSGGGVVRDDLVLLGSRPHDELALWMAAADVLLLPSRSEGMPNVVLEALTIGLPVVATAVGACPALLAGESAARLVPVADVAACAEAVGVLLDARPDREALARRHAGRFDWGRMADTVLGLMAESTRGGETFP